MRKLSPVPLAPRHRRVWKRWRRWCSCGLRWASCPDRWLPVPTEPPAGRYDNRPRWDSLTIANPQVGRAGRLTRAQAWRANGGRWEAVELLAQTMRPETAGVRLHRPAADD